MNNAFSNKLKELREKYNYSYQDVGDKIGLAKQSIFKFEKGEKKPSSDTVIKLSQLFNVPFDFFYKADTDTAFDNIQFREDYKLVNKNHSAAQIKLEVLDFVNKLSSIERLLGEVRNFENPLKDIKISTEKDVEKAAKVLRKRWKLGNAPINDVVDLLEDKGIVIIEVNRSEDFTGLCGLYNKNIPIIVLNEQCLNIGRKRFTALHELAHIILEFVQNLSEEKIESLCDFFAGAVLLVDEILIEKIGKKRTSISLAELKAIKETYGISIKAIIVRTRFSGLITFETFQNWKAQYSEWVGGSSDENDFGSFYSKEKTSRFYKLLKRGIQENKISLSKAAEFAGQAEDFFSHDNEPYFSVN